MAGYLRSWLQLVFNMLIAFGVHACVEKDSAPGTTDYMLREYGNVRLRSLTSPYNPSRFRGRPSFSRSLALVHRSSLLS
ncbi:uncharacterized protein BT62DRAFT_935036 [Guyanagaster necrorhizus]|uniref:Secreted protein n=1 Tax=Guyanagaster necrorhizus TaxID=856835 RepID=A0A9P8APW0_9AGAR|nr:uncharacterized protein BT62DRAFT_935036 [Guyanagaster necrorhizus MCA 3950]KAG7443419.1 hypothetical protein BT62DRAFT_935036 [Guyanagaster necrorhizus MCA 3950]